MKMKLKKKNLIKGAETEKTTSKKRDTFLNKLIHIVTYVQLKSNDNSKLSYGKNSYKKVARKQSMRYKAHTFAYFLY